MLSQHADEAYAFQLLKDGTARLAYLLKERVGDLDELLRAFRETIAGRSVIDPAMVEALLASRGRLAHSPLASLTRRETDVLREMAQGKTNAAIADSLSVSESAVERYANAILTLLAAGVAIVLGGTMSRWAGWAAIVIGVMYVSTLPFGPDATPAGLLGYLWLFAVAGYYAVRPGRARELEPGVSRASFARGLPTGS